MIQVSIQEYMAIAIYLGVYILSLIVNIHIYLKTNKQPLVNTYFYTQILFSIWILAIIFRIISCESYIMWFWLSLEYLVVCLFSIEVCNFCHAYKYNKEIHRKILYPLRAFGLCNVFVMFTNEYHHLFFKDVDNVTEEFGDYYKIVFLFGLIMLTIGARMIFTSKKSRSMKKYHQYLFLGLMVLPILLNIIQQIFLKNFIMNLTPIALSVFTTIIGVLAVRFNYFNVKKIHRIEIFDNLYEGIIILDKENRILEYNQNFYELVKPIININRYFVFDEVLKNYRDYISNFDEVYDMFQSFQKSLLSKTTGELYYEGKERSYVFLIEMQKTYNEKGNPSETIIKFVDITKNQELLQDLSAKNEELDRINQKITENISINRRLVMERERSHISKEIHDILGKTITLDISLLEHAYTVIDSDEEEALTKIRYAKDMTKKGLDELRDSLHRTYDEMIQTSELVKEIENLVKEFSQVGMEIAYLPKYIESKITPKEYDTIYRVCQEGLTNAHKHGKAKKVTIALTFTNKKVDIVIVDNGKGVKNFVRGNGTKGMENRVEELGGTITFGSPESEGFNIRVNMPIVPPRKNINIT